MKDTALYLEADEDITSAIDKLSKIEGDSVQIVVPKRSTMLQSIINLKLLKKAADDSGKELALVTGDKVATDLAGRVGLAVASTLGGAAVVAAPTSISAPSNEDIIEEEDAATLDDADKPAEPAKAAAKVSAIKVPKFVRRDVDESKKAAKVVESAAAPAAVASAAESADEAPAAADAVKVPNFNKLRRRMLWVAVLALLVGGYFGYMALFKKGTVTLYATGSKIAVNSDFTVAVDGTSDAKKDILAGRTVTADKDLSGTVTATGQKDNGTKASGTMTIINNDPTGHDFVSGTRFVAGDGKVYRSTADAHVDGATAGFSGFQIVRKPAQTTVSVTADANGDGYNKDGGRYTIPGLSTEQQQYTYGQGGTINGGTSKVVKVLQQSDVDKAKADLLAKDKDSGTETVKTKLPSGFRALPDSLTQTASAVVATPAVGEEADTATLSVKATYAQLAVSNDELKAYVTAAEQEQVGPNSQIYDDGLDGAEITTSGGDGSERTFHLSVDAYGGQKLDAAAIATQLKGLRYGDAVDAAGKLPGVERAEVVLSPAWSTSLPGNAGKITVTIKVAQRN